MCNELVVTVLLFGRFLILLPRVIFNWLLESLLWLLLGLVLRLRVQIIVGLGAVPLALSSEIRRGVGGLIRVVALALSTDSLAWLLLLSLFLQVPVSYACWRECSGLLLTLWRLFPLIVSSEIGFSLWIAGVFLLYGFGVRCECA